MTEQLHFHFYATGEGNGNPLQCSCLENSTDGGAWWAAVYGVAQSRTRLKWLSSSSSTRDNVNVAHGTEQMLSEYTLPPPRTEDNTPNFNPAAPSSIYFIIKYPQTSCRLNLLDKSIS